jgi:uncharacterized protein YkwD
MLAFAILAFVGISPTSPLLGEAGNSLRMETQMVQGSATWEAAPTVPPPTALIPPASIEGGDVEPTYSGCGGGTSPSINAAYEQEVVERVNTIRASKNLPPLKRITPLDNAARYHATDMGQDNYFAHDTYDRVSGNLVQVCGWVSRVESYYPNWWSLAENIAAGQPTPQDVMSAWMSSPGHSDQILSTSNWEIGVGYYQDVGSTHYWVQNFGRRSSVYPLIINREAATTDSTNVSLYIYGTWDEIRLRNDDGSWTDWQPFQANMSWTLKNEPGERTVWAEMRTGSQTATSSDTICLIGPTLGNLPNALQFTYSIPDQRLLPTSHRVTPQNVGNADTLTWSITSMGTWFTVSPLGSTTPNSFWITPTTYVTASVMTYTGAVTVTVTDPSDVEGSPHPIDLTLRTVNFSFSYIHLPLIVKSYAP